MRSNKEQQLIDMYFKGNRENATKLLLSAHLGFIINAAHTLRGYQVPTQDLIQEGVVGFLEALNRFNPNNDYSLISYAQYYIHAQMFEYIARNYSITNMGSNKSDKKLFYNLRKFTDPNRFLTNKELEAISDTLKVPLENVKMMESRFFYKDVPADGSLIDHSDPYKTVEAVDERFHKINIIKNNSKYLTNRQKDIIIHRYLSEKVATLEELAEKHGISIERVRQIEQQSLQKLRGIV